MKNSHGFGARVQRLRRRLKLSQKDLGTIIEVSQATISRIEDSEKPPGDTRLITRLSAGLGVSVNELIAGLEAPSALIHDATEEFYAFCPNPFCDSNRTGEKDGEPLVWWNSGARYDGHLFDEINYCARCGTDMVKNCPSCDKRLRSPGTRYCVTCGTAVTDRPTKEEWQRIREQNAKAAENELPF